MDIHCRYCGEPWEHDNLHDMGELVGVDLGYFLAAKSFKALGCNAFRPTTGRLRELAGLPPKPRHCTAEPILPADMLRHIADSQDMSAYPEEWADPVDIGYMLEIAEEMFG